MKSPEQLSIFSKKKTTKKQDPKRQATLKQEQAWLKCPQQTSTRWPLTPKEAMTPVKDKKAPNKATKETSETLSYKWR